MSASTDSVDAASVAESGRRRRALLILAVVAVSVGLDQWTKHLAITHLMGEPPIVYWNDVFRLQFATNAGAFLSLGSQLPEGIRFWILTGLNGVILLGVGAFLFLKRDVGRGMAWALALILSGGVGNIIDRIRHDGLVIDFMNLGWPWWPMEIRTGIFNVADLAIVAGLVLLVGTELFRPVTTPPAPKAK